MSGSPGTSESGRESALAAMRTRTFDVCVVGGGIHGASAAAALCRRGASVALVERGDFASATSQESSNFVWGGIKYLETFELQLVAELCAARNRLVELFPSRVQEVRFVISVERGFRRSRGALLLGTVLYWMLGRCRTRPPHALGIASLAKANPQLSTRGLAGAVEYSDALLVDGDARFVFQLLKQAVKDGCVALNYARAEAASRSDALWQIAVRDQITGQRMQIRSRILINACGPQVDTLNATLGARTQHRHVFSKGVHLIVDRVDAGRTVWTHFADDGRLFFIAPLGSKACIGTTDTRVPTPAAQVSDADRAFILDNANRCLALETPLTTEDIIAERCGVRPLVVESGFDPSGEDWLELSRRHVLEADWTRKQISLFGGKLTDCVNVAAEVCDTAAEMGVALSRVDSVFRPEDPALRRAFLEEAAALRIGPYRDRLPAVTCERLWRRYEADAFRILSELRRDPALASPLAQGVDLLLAELHHAARDEMIVTLQDFLRRRSSLELTFGREALCRAPWLKDVCDILFGAEGERRLEAYRREPGREAPRVSLG